MSRHHLQAGLASELISFRLFTPSSTRSPFLRSSCDLSDGTQLGGDAYEVSKCGVLPSLMMAGTSGPWGTKAMGTQQWENNP
ncbi:hypothetical protein Pcinc_008411 [Petrolisthes cinctipes]|uniref:Uncharacterized protein n=1 Tax=Petrolisthes cinctipes TaxID=88211 RepID=A0AAE1KWH4_PETCI|nr:hypothetical protein Pcinc_008411 [Petrolisthes cinctipes]